MGICHMKLWITELNRGAPFRWSFGPHSACGSIESTTILTTHPRLVENSAVFLVDKNVSVFPLFHWFTVPFEKFPLSNFPYQMWNFCEKFKKWGDYCFGRILTSRIDL